METDDQATISGLAKHFEEARRREGVIKKMHPTPARTILLPVGCEDVCIHLQGDTWTVSFLNDQDQTGDYEGTAKELWLAWVWAALAAKEFGGLSLRLVEANGGKMDHLALGVVACPLEGRP